MGAAWGPPKGVALQRWQWGLLCSVGLCTELGAAWGGPAAGVEVGAGNGGPQCHPPRHCALDAGAAFSLNGKSGRNLGPFQSRRSRAPAAIRRQGKRWGERGGCGGGGLCAALCAASRSPPWYAVGRGHLHVTAPRYGQRNTFNGMAVGGGVWWSFPLLFPPPAQCTRISILWLPRFLHTGTSPPPLADSTTVTATSPFGNRVENLGEIGGMG